ncbi:hypothetical protein [Aureimonas altamirensis]|nr:hypothetical protein [Aureimonas altamirensis]
MAELSIEGPLAMIYVGYVIIVAVVVVLAIVLIGPLTALISG